MKKSRFADNQIAEVLKRVEAGLSAPELGLEMGVSSATFYKYGAKHGGIDSSMMARLKELEVENARLKKRMPRRGSRLRSQMRPSLKSGEARCCCSLLPDTT